MWGKPSLPRGDRQSALGAEHCTLTRGDFHHPEECPPHPPACAPPRSSPFRRCDSGEASATATPHPTVAPKASLAIFQVSQVSGGPELREWDHNPTPTQPATLPTPHPPPVVPLTSGWEVGA